MKTIKIKELVIEVEKEETQKGVPFNKIKIPKGWRLLTGTEAMFLWENYRNKINLNWFYVNPTKDFTTARFVAESDWAGLISIWDPVSPITGLGVRLCREIK